MSSGTTGFRKLALRFGGYLSGDGVNYLLGFLVYAWLVRLLNNRQYGELSVATNIYQILVMFVALGMDLVGPRMVSDAADDPFSLVSRIQRLRIAVACVLCAPVLVLISAAYLHRGNVTIAAVLAGAFLMVLARALDVNYLAVAFSEPGLLVRSRALGIGVYLATLVGLKFAVTRYLWVIPVLNAIGVTVGRVWLLRLIKAKHQNLPRLRLSLNSVPKAWEILIRGTKASLGQLLLLAFQTLDVVLLSRYASPDVVGQYAIVSRLYLFGTAVLTALLNTFLPELIASLTDRDKLSRHFRTFLSFSALLGLAGGSMFLLFGSCFGQVFAHRPLPQVALIAPVYALVFLGMSLSNPFSSTLPCFNREGQYVACVSIAAICLLVVDLFLIPRFGALGAAWGQAISTGVLAITSAAQFRTFLRNFPRTEGAELTGNAVQIAGVSL